jgi:hypothetical protein
MGQAATARAIETERQRVADEAASVAHGEFARLNFPEGQHQ